MVRWVEVVGGPFDGSRLPLALSDRSLSIFAPAGYVACHSIEDTKARYTHAEPAPTRQPQEG